MSQKKRPQRVKYTLDFIEGKIRQKLARRGIKVPQDLTKKILEFRDDPDFEMNAVILGEMLEWRSGDDDTHRIREFLLSNSFVIERPGGEFITVTELQENLTDAERLKPTVRIKGKGVKVANLADCDIARILKVGTKLVEKVRRELAV